MDIYVRVLKLSTIEIANNLKSRTIIRYFERGVDAKNIDDRVYRTTGNRPNTIDKNIKNYLRENIVIAYLSWY